MRSRTGAAILAALLLSLTACDSTTDDGGSVDSTDSAAASPGDGEGDESEQAGGEGDSPACDAWQEDLLDRDLQDDCMAELGERVYTADERAAWVDALRDIDPGLVAEQGSGYDSLAQAEREIVYRGADTCTRIADHHAGNTDEGELLESVAAQYYIDYRQVDTDLARPIVDAAERVLCSDH
ncbi:hypothetical protein [Streptomyces alkaliphilus]|uniref:hypothetical protein n=1 Tax=Streptomyces alkaliphilus TaxID=1472722 RepID=UPI00117D48B9|nr:hypothetical protein [Streptomyces alkaliphilus]MQS07836.1 hypothetical protein [Streptomyces alkaliphilus]